jgi:hypothetical protein
VGGDEKKGKLTILTKLTGRILKEERKVVIKKEGKNLHLMRH